MNVAIPLFGTRVSPRFDCAQAVLIFETSDDGEQNRREITTFDLAPHERINRLLEFGIDTVVCGGIDRWSAESLHSAGVKIFASVTGEAEDALNNLLEGSLTQSNANAGISADDSACFEPGSGGRRMNQGFGGQVFGGGRCLGGGRGKRGGGGGRGRRRGGQ